MGEGGAAYILFNQGQMIKYELQHLQEFSPLQMEAKALCMAVK
jgi:hypothetical protein